jgi:hypothetical protein
MQYAIYAKLIIAFRGTDLLKICRLGPSTHVY